MWVYKYIIPPTFKTFCMFKKYFDSAAKIIFVYSLTVICTCLTTYAQTSNNHNDSGKVYKNSVKLNVTAMLLYEKAFQVGYERILSKNRSINISGGYNEFPLSWGLDIENTKLTSSNSNSGYSIGVDYRFYLGKENKYA